MFWSVKRQLNSQNLRVAFFQLNFQIFIFFWLKVLCIIAEPSKFIMSIINISHAEITTFILVGMPGLEYAHIWISIPMCSMYLIALLGNCTIPFIIKTEPSLHEPMYYFLSILTLSDMGLSFSSLPTMLRIFLFKASEISANACFAQQFFIHGFTALESSVLLIMSFDRFLAINNPLRYSFLLQLSELPKLELYAFSRASSWFFPFPSLWECWNIVRNANYHIPTVSTRMSWSWPALTTRLMSFMAFLEHSALW